MKGTIDAETQSCLPDWGKRGSGWERGWPTGGSSLAEGVPLGMDSGEGAHPYSGSPTPTFISRRGRGRAAVFMMLLVKYVGICVCIVWGKGSIKYTDLVM